MLLKDIVIALICLFFIVGLSKEPDCGAKGFLIGFAIMGFLGAVVEGCCRLGIFS